MSMVRHFCAVLGLLSVLNSSASEAPYPEVFDEFITGWVDYDDGYYAAALRSFARAHALDPEFRPATEAMAASLGQMGMPEIGEAILRDPWVSKGSKHDFQPSIAFWGIFHDAEIQDVSSGGLQHTVVAALGELVDLPLVLTSPSGRTWAERKNQNPCTYNLLIFLFQEEGQDYATARIHLIQNYSIESGKELDLTLSTLPARLTHQSVEIRLDSEEIAQLSTNQAFREGLLELFDPDVAIENPTFKIDPATEASFEDRSISDPWICLSKASVSTEYALLNYQRMRMLYRPYKGKGSIVAAIGPGLPEWLAHQLEVEHPMRPWLLAEAERENMSNSRWHPKKAKRLREELMRDHPDHPALIAVQLCREVWSLNHLNYEEKMSAMLPLVEKLSKMPPELFSHPRSLEYLARFEKTIRACLGQPPSEPFVPFLIGGGYQKMIYDGSFRLNFNGGTPITMEEREVHTIENHEEFALELLIGHMTNINDTSVIFSLYKEHIDREDALGVYLRSSKNWVMWRFKCGDKVTRKAASEWWIQRAVNVIESDADWNEVSKALPGYYLEFSDYNQPMLEAMNRRLEQRGLRTIDENARLARECTTEWKISFLELSPKGQQVVIQYYRARGKQDLENYLWLLAWLNRSEAQDFFRSEVLHAQEAYIPYLNAESDSYERVKLANNYAHLLVTAGEHQIALDVCEFVFPDLLFFEKKENASKLQIAYALLTIRIKALIGLGRKEEALREIDRIIEELDGHYMSYQESYAYISFAESKKESLSSTLLEMKAEIEQKQ